MGIMWKILSFILMFAVILGAYALCRTYVFAKIRINKWIPLVIGITLFVVQYFVGRMNIYVNVVLSIFTVLFILWFIDILQTGGPKKKEKQIVIKPKAKPNRVKNKNK